MPSLSSSSSSSLLFQPSLLLYFVIHAKTIFLTSKKVDQVARIGGRGVGEVIWAMAERFFSFFRRCSLTMCTWVTLFSPTLWLFSVCIKSTFLKWKGTWYLHWRFFSFPCCTLNQMLLILSDDIWGKLELVQPAPGSDIEDSDRCPNFVRAESDLMEMLFLSVGHCVRKYCRIKANYGTLSVMSERRSP